VLTPHPPPLRKRGQGVKTNLEIQCGQHIEELRDRREGKGCHCCFGYLMQVEGKGRVFLRQGLSGDT